jgi:DNA-binding transcriptional regulator YhcF (GntR family)
MPTDHSQLPSVTELAMDTEVQSTEVRKKGPRAVREIRDERARQLQRQREEQVTADE